MPEHRKHTPIVSRKQQMLFGAELSRREEGRPPEMPSITDRELREHLEESRGKKLPERVRGKTLTSNFMNEVIIYGGLPLRRSDVYKDALKQTGSEKAADMFAFSVRHKTVDIKPLSYEEYNRLTRTSKVKLLKLHDDGDMTLQKGKQKYVVTTNREVFKKVNISPPKFQIPKINYKVRHHRRSRIIR